MTSAMGYGSVGSEYGQRSTDPFRERQAPYSEDAEQAVISAMLMDADAIVTASEIIDDAAFYAERHRRIFRAIVSVAERGSVVDPLTLADELQRKGELDAAGGKDYIGYLVDAVPTAANVEYHAEIVREKSILRILISTSAEITREAFEGKLGAKELLDLAEAKVFHVSQQRRADGFVRLKELLWPAMERIEGLSKNQGQGITGIASGFRDLDDMTSGFQNADLVIIAARPSMGKTAFSLNLAAHAAIEAHKKVGYFSLEMSKEQLVQRMLTAEARVDAQRLRKGMLRDDEYPMLARAAGILSSASVWIDDTPSLSLLELRSKARRLKADGGLDMIVVDYLQLMRGPDSENRQQEVSQISRGLKAIAKELTVPVLALSQLSRAPEQRTGDHRPQLSDLRDSGAIEQDADLIMFLYRQELYDGLTDKDGNSLDGKTELIVGKQRNGPTGTVNLLFHKFYTRFADWSPRLVA